RPRCIAFTPDGAKAYVACERADTVYVLDAREHKILRTIKAGLRSNGLAMHPDGKRVYLTNGGAGNVMVIDTATNSVTATIPVGQRPWNMALTPDGRKLYVACGRSGSVSVIDVERGARIADIAVGKLPWGVAIRRFPRPRRAAGHRNSARTSVFPSARAMSAAVIPRSSRRSVRAPRASSSFTASSCPSPAAPLSGVRL